MGSAVCIMDDSGELDKDDSEYVGIGFKSLAIVIVYRSWSSWKRVASKLQVVH